MPARTAQASAEYWTALRDQALVLAAACQEPKPALHEVGKALAQLAERYLQVIHAAGHTSMRMQAVAKALDLKTPKRALEMFLNADSRPPSGE